MNAPATAPTGPKTTAPDRAPSAAAPARSWAFASNETRDPAIRAATSSFFIAIPRMFRDDYGTPKLRRQRGAGFTLSPQSGRFPIEKGPQRNSPRGLSDDLCDSAAMPLI